MSIRAALIMVLTFVFGIVPATYLVFWASIFGLFAIVALIVPPVETGGSSVVPWKVALMLMAAGAAVAGYAALWRSMSGATSRVANGLMLGIAANAYGIYLMYDINAYAMRQWSTWVWFVSPIVVAAAHLGLYVVSARRPSPRDTG
jgi:hypothetical protein